MADNGHGHHGAANLTPEQQKQMIEQELRLFEHMKNIKYKIAVMSGKGGVGKSTVAANLAEAFQKKGLLTGILDADIHGPNIPKMLGVEGEDVMIANGEMIPVMSKNGIKVMSMGFLIDSQDTPIIWRGPQKSGSIKQFMADTAWGDLDVLIIDNPPGTGDEPLTVLQALPSVDAVIMVTVLKCVGMVKMLNIEDIGLIENMSYYVCPHCGEKTNIFGESHGEDFANEMGVVFLGNLPLTEQVPESANQDSTMVNSYADSEVTQKFSEIIDNIKLAFLDED